MGGTSTSELRVMSGKDRQVFRRARSHLGPGMRSLSLVGTTQAPPLGLKEAKVAPRNHLTLRKCKHTTSSFGRGWGGGGGRRRDQGATPRELQGYSHILVLMLQGWVGLVLTCICSTFI